MTVTIKPGVKPLIKNAKPSPVKPGVQLIAKDEAAPPPKMTVKVKQPTATITKDHSDGTTEMTQEAVGDPVIASELMANVGVQMGVTRNLGNFENFKFSVSLHIPCPADEQGINDAYEVAKTWVDARISEINAEMDEQLGGGN